MPDPAPLTPLELLPIGDVAVLIRVGAAIDAATHARVRAVCAALEREPIAGVVELVPAYAAVAVHYDPLAVPGGGEGAYARVAAAVEARLTGLEPADPPPGRLVELPVRYGGEDGPDLEEVAAHAGLSAEEVVRRHAAADYTVYMIGFAPGFPFLAGLPPGLAMPRRESPRQAVPAGSVAIGGAQTGVYPIETPGGWRIIGRTDVALFTADEEPPTLLRLGDRVRFVVDGLGLGLGA